MRSMTRVMYRLAGAAVLAALSIGTMAVAHDAEPGPRSVVSAEPDWGASTAATPSGPTTPKEPDWD
ncbi:hypothetical protein [Streptomyces sp. NPDC058548]|uniref:hypothetical protein n=1 Tax=Streptomyces sp. NPDC058548 TaxID=3346545 RepID=UPI00364FDC38